MSEYFTDREFGERPPTSEVIDVKIWNALCSLVRLKIGDGSFGYRFPESCSDGNLFCGCDSLAFRHTLTAEVPWIEWPLPSDPVPETPVILDVVEFCANAVGRPKQEGYHSYLKHYHLSWDRSAGLESFVEEINLLFSRNGLAFCLNSEGKACRILPEVLSNSLSWAKFQTGDDEADRLLEAARANIVSPKIDGRRDALEKLWDAFERIKSLGGEDKKSGIAALLDQVSPSGSKMRTELESEAKALTAIGNSYRIRHSEVTQEQIASAQLIDWLFGRMFGFLHLVLKATGRAS